MLANEFVERRTDIPHTCGRSHLHLIVRWASKNLGEDFGMDLEEDLFPLVGWDALHEYP